MPSSCDPDNDGDDEDDENDENTKRKLKSARKRKRGHVLQASLTSLTGDEKEDLVPGLTSTELREFRDAFAVFDQHDTGIITMDDLVDLYEGLTYQLRGEHLKQMMGMYGLT